MIKNITGLWGFKKNGELLFCCKIKGRNSKSELDDDLLTGYLCAFFYFSKDILHDPVQHFTTKLHHYCMIKKDSFMFAGRFEKSKLSIILPSEFGSFVSRFLRDPEEVLQKFRYDKASILKLKNILKDHFKLEAKLSITNNYP